MSKLKITRNLNMIERYLLADNPNTPKPILSELCDDTNNSVLRAAL